MFKDREVGMAKGYQKHMERKRKIAGKRVVGIDPAGRNHQAAVVNEQGIQQGKSFMFPVSHEGYEVKLWKELAKVLGSYGPENLVFAICQVFSKLGKSAFFV